MKTLQFDPAQVKWRLAPLAQKIVAATVVVLLIRILQSVMPDVEAAYFEALWGIFTAVAAGITADILSFKGFNQFVEENEVKPIAEIEPPVE